VLDVLLPLVNVLFNRWMGFLFDVDIFKRDATAKSEISCGSYVCLSDSHSLYVIMDSHIVVLYQSFFTT